MIIMLKTAAKNSFHLKLLRFTYKTMGIKILFKILLTPLNKRKNIEIKARDKAA
jgi:hypothetical protein